jgi:hypothetical protein
LTALTSLIPAPYGLILATGAGLLSFRYSDRILDFALGREKTVSEKPEQIIVTPVEAPPPNLDVYPLQHFKGHALPPKVETRELGDGQKESTLTAVGPSHPEEYNRLAISQKLEVFGGPIDKPPKELIVKFGVIRVYCIEGDALGCRAELRYRILEQLGQKFSMAMVSGGYLNWFRLSMKRDIQNHLESIDSERGQGINKYLQNTLEDLHQGDEKDLLLFYMIKDLPAVFLCTDVNQASLGSLVPGKGIKAEIEIALTAQRYPKTSWRFLVTVSDWDDFSIQRM